MNNTNNDNNLINLNVLSSILFIIGSFISLSITLDEKRNINNQKKIYSNEEALNISFYNRILILIAVLISLYVGFSNYKSEKNNTRAKYKSSLLLTTNILTVISALIILYVSYLNKQDQSLTVSDVENPLI
ncbi:MAG: hypothetical protein IJ105_00530 [Bacilli bacterium]|nr:hypothetical protein [Bacilli bacterium]